MLFSVGLLACNAVGNYAIGAIGSATLGLDPAYALPKITWAVMGLQDTSGPSDNNKGWYNGYIWKFTGDEYKPETVQQDAQRCIAESVGKFTSDFGYAVDFFSKKYYSEWCDPDYESIVASNWSGAPAGRPIMAERNMSKILHSLYYGKIGIAVFSFLDILQFSLLLGAIVYTLVHWREGLTAMAPLLICAGTALFYLVWEAQSQYVMHAYVYMIPYAAFGLSKLGLVFRERIHHK